MNMEFDEIRPYHDEELPQIYEELIADPAFQQVASAVSRKFPLRHLRRKCVHARRSWSFRKHSVTQS